MNKCTTNLLKKHKIKPSFFIQFGYLGETKEDIQKTISMINELLPYDIGISVSYPLPGTVFYEKVKTELHQKANWTDSDELALMFKNTYQPAFYRQLHRYVHKSYRKHLALHHMSKISMATFKIILSAAYYSITGLIAKIKLQQLERSSA